MPGRCFRRDTADASHLPVFHQIEGLVVDRGITFCDLAGTIETFTTAYFGPDVHSRLRPSYFPFTEPSAEYDITCTICLGVGCRTCSGTGWLELGGCGMVDPAVFDAVGIDPSRVVGLRVRVRHRPLCARCVTRWPTCGRSSRTICGSSGSSKDLTCRAPLSWLRDFAPFDDDVDVLRAALDDLGLLVEGIERVGEGLDGSSSRPRDRDRRHRGRRPDPPGRRRRRATSRSRSCAGPSTSRSATWSRFAGVGTVLPGGVEIGRRTMLGVESNGMLCSGKELALSDDADGLLVLSGTEGVAARHAARRGARHRARRRVRHHRRGEPSRRVVHRRHRPRPGGPPRAALRPARAGRDRIGGRRSASLPAPSWRHPRCARASPSE